MTGALKHAATTVIDEVVGKPTPTCRRDEVFDAVVESANNIIQYYIKAV